MVDNSWAFDLESKVFTLIKTRTKTLENTYPTIKYTTTYHGTDDAIYPTVHIHELGGNEVGSTINGTEISGLYSSFQIDVYANTSRDDARYIMATISQVLKMSGFSINEMPTFDTNPAYYHMMMRCRRTLCEGDL